MAIPTVHLNECPEPPAYVPESQVIGYCTCQDCVRSGRVRPMSVTSFWVSGFEAHRRSLVNADPASYRLV